MCPQIAVSVDFPNKPNQENYLKVLLTKAETVLRENVFRGKKDSLYTAASGKASPPGGGERRFLYPFQWLWDTFFIAAWSEDVDQSIKDVRKFLASQSENGFLGHIRYNREVLSQKEYFPPPEVYFPSGLPKKGEITSRITQPPNVAYGVLELCKRIEDKRKRRDFMIEVFLKIYRYHEYLYSNLVRGGLMVTIHPWQAGDDNSPKWDEIYKTIGKAKIHQRVLGWLTGLGLADDRVDVKIIAKEQRPINPDYDIYLYLLWLYNKWSWDEKTILSRSPFRIADPLTNAVLLRSNRCLLLMARELGNKNAAREITGWIRQTKKGLSTLWNEKAGLYYARDLASRRFIRVGTVSSLMPLFCQEIPKSKAALLAAKIREVSLDNPLAYLVPSTFPGQDSFEPVRYWRGPVWVIINTLLAEGLSHYGYHDLMKKITLDSLKLVYQSLSDRGGFFEYFDPLTGAGLGSPLQSWTAAAVFRLAELLRKYEA